MLKRNNIRSSSDDFGSVIVDTQTGEWYGANPVASFLLSLLDTPRTMSELVSAVVTEFAVDATTADHDVQRFCELLLLQRIVWDCPAQMSISRKVSGL